MGNVVLDLREVHISMFCLDHFVHQKSIFLYAVLFVICDLNNLKSVPSHTHTHKILQMNEEDKFEKKAQQTN